MKAYTVTGALLLATVTTLIGFSIRAQAAITTFDDKAAFLAATGASSASGPLPRLGAGISLTVGSVTFTALSSSLIDRIFIGTPIATGFPDDWYVPLPGNDIAINDRENIDVAFAGPVFSMGFDFASELGFYIGQSILSVVALYIGFSTGLKYVFLFIIGVYISSNAYPYIFGSSESRAWASLGLITTLALCLFPLVFGIAGKIACVGKVKYNNWLKKDAAKRGAT